MLTTPGSPENHKSWQENAARKERAKVVIRQYTRKECRRTLDTATSDIQWDLRTFYKWLSWTAGWTSKKLAVGSIQPVKHPETGELLTDPVEINSTWLTHYGALTKDKTENSRSPVKWVHWRGHPQRRHLEYLGTDIESPELMGALKRLKRYEAPGNDGIPADFLELVISTKGMSRLFRVLLNVINLMWRGVCIPKAWQDSTVVSIPKKGDVTDTNNYRGIFLMGTGLKVLTTIMRVRPNGAFEAEKLFTPAHAGFRKSAECVTQAVCWRQAEDVRLRGPLRF